MKSKRFENRMRKVYQIYEELKSLRQYLNSNRILLLRTTNGGGLPSPGKVLYASIIAEVNGPDDVSMTLRDEWQNRLIDHDYIRMLERVFTDGHVVNVVSEMAEHSMLRGAYEKLGITQTRVIKVGIFNNAFYYISIASTKDRVCSPAEKYTIDTTIQNIQKLLN